MKWELYTGTLIPEDHPQKDWIVHKDEKLITTFETRTDSLCEASAIANEIRGYEPYKPMEGCDCKYCQSNLIT